MFCKICGQKLNDDSNFCTHCGSPVKKVVYTIEPKKNNPFCIVGFILSIVGRFTFTLSFIFSITGIVFSAIGMKEAKKRNEKMGLGIAGLVIGIAFFVIILPLLLLALIFPV